VTEEEESMSLEVIEERILKDAQVEAESILNKAKEEANEIIRQAALQAENAYSLLLRSEAKKTEISCSQILSQARMDSRKSVRECRDAVVNECFSRAEEYLKTVRSSPGYPGIFQHLLMEGLDILGIRKTELIVHPEDRQLAMAMAESFTGKDFVITLSEESLECLGGFVLRAPERRIEVDNTFEARKERFFRALIIEISGMLFSREGERS
jgi:V/A-type H+-transporting ATPase subunit E